MIPIRKETGSIPHIPSAKEHVLIRKVVLENTHSDGSPSTEALSGLLKYLKNPATADVVYQMLIERVTNDRSQNEVILLRSVKLLKTHLPKYVPSQDTLTKLDHFCQNVTTSNEAISKSILYIRALVSKSLVGTAKLSDSRPKPPSESLLERSDKSLSPESAKTSPSGSRKPSHESNRAMVLNYLALRCPPRFLRKSSQVTLLASLQFGGQFKRIVPETSAAVQTVGQALKLTDVNQIAEHVKTVSSEKKREELKLVQEAGHLPGRRKGPQLFQYKYYKEQVPLSLNTEEMEQVVNTVVNPPPDDHESHLIASKILIKLLIDTYCGDEKMASQLILSIFFEMLASPQIDIKVHSFNLLFNLSIHMNLLDETSLLGETSEQNLSGRNQIELIQEELLHVCLEMLLWQDEKVWAAGLNCMLYFITQDGKIPEKKLALLDARLVAAFLVQLGSAKDQLHKKLLRMLLAKLYSNGRGLDVPLLKKMGGIRFILGQYTQARCLETCDNLFLIIYDYAIHQLVVDRKLEPDSEQITLLLEVLKRYEAPQYCPAIFKFVPEKFVEHLVRFIFLEQLKKDPAMHEVATKLDKNFVIQFLYEIEKLATAYQRLEPEFEVRLQNTQGHTDAQTLTDNFKLLNELLHSVNEDNRRNGEAWLFFFVRYTYENPKLVALASATDSSFSKLLHSPNPLVRRIYLSITERMILVQRSKMQSAGDEYRVNAIFKLINDNFGRFTLPQFREKNENNLMYMFDILFSLVSYRTGETAANEGECYRESEDSNYELFLRGKAVLSLELLSEILHNLFMQLPPPTHSYQFNRVKTAILLMMIERCKDSQALDIVGMAFFRQLLADRNPEIAYYASRFLIDQLQAERPEQYTAILTTLLSKAQQTNDEKLLANPYLQINEMIRGFAQGDDTNNQKRPST